MEKLHTFPKQMLWYKLTNLPFHVFITVWESRVWLPSARQKISSVSINNTPVYSTLIVREPRIDDTLIEYHKVANLL